MSIVFGDNQYGKVDCRLVRMDRDVDGKPGRNALTDITVTTTLAGDFTDTHLRGNNRTLLPTDSHKNAVYAMAKDSIGQIEDFGQSGGIAPTDTARTTTGRAMAGEPDTARSVPPRAACGSLAWQDTPCLVFS
jgi:urate oxidase